MAKKIDQLVAEAGYRRTDHFGKVCQYVAKKVRPKPTTVEEVLDIAVPLFGMPPDVLEMRRIPQPFKMLGEEGKDFQHGAIAQMETCSRMPVYSDGMLMPDGQPGWGIPIGGVVVLDEAVSPRFVGADIACRMRLTILKHLKPGEIIGSLQKAVLDMILNVSHFGSSDPVFGDGYIRDHEVMEDLVWKEIKALGRLRAKAAKQLGTSGSSNHFVEVVVGVVVAENSNLPLRVGDEFVALMTHSGSRGTGKQIGDHYSDVAVRESKNYAKKIPPFYEWLYTDSEAGQEYLAAMNLMGRYAAANHELIHQFFLRISGFEELVHFENHHNFAWELPDGRVLHRKGATPAEKGRMGIIPGSSGTAAYLVEGFGNEEYLNSSSHGAGRVSAPSKVIENYDAKRVEAHYAKHNILRHGVAKCETLFAYKDIERVMSLQSELVKPIARMFPRVVVMGGDAPTWREIKENKKRLSAKRR
ncbi:MAG: RtcB family protein [bacterium]|nr:RtcB family protein [bacterium]